MTHELYKKYRPQTLERMVGNEATVAALANMLKRNTVPHAMLFRGPSGCGKTTLARLAAKAMGCAPVDYIEVNSSNNRGIDTIREIQQNMHLAPAAGACRVWMLDEAHKMSNDAQNAALKMLEDTPAHVYFFICTTDANRMIKAIQTRCTDMPVELLSYEQLTALCTRVCKKEGFTDLDEKTVDTLVTAAQGSPRQLLVVLDKVAQLPAPERDAALQAKLDEGVEALELCRALLKPGTPWKKIAKLLDAITADEEEVRWSVLGYAKTVLLKEGTFEAYNVIKSFQEPFYSSKGAGLAAACFEIVNPPK